VVAEVVEGLDRDAEIGGELGDGQNCSAQQVPGLGGGVGVQ
jgi:hypothetical protein